MFRPRIAKKHAPYLFAIGMGTAMGVVISTIMTLLTVGFTSGFWLAWWTSFLGGSAIGIPTSFVVAPIVNTLIEYITLAEPE